MEELYPVNLTIGEINIVHNIVGQVLSSGRYEKGNWDLPTTKEVMNLLNKIDIIQDNAYREINKY